MHPSDALLRYFVESCGGEIEIEFLTSHTFVFYRHRDSFPVRACSFNLATTDWVSVGFCAKAVEILLGYGNHKVIVSVCFSTCSQSWIEESGIACIHVSVALRDRSSARERGKEGEGQKANLEHYS